MSNILEVTLKEGQTFATATRLWKGDYGQILLIHGLDLPAYYEVHFASTKADAPQTQVGTPEGVLIPNKFLQTDGYIYAWIFLHTGENDGETKYQIKIPVEDKGIPIDQETPEEKTAVQQAIEALNKQTGVATGAAASAEESAQRAEEAAASIDEGMIADAVAGYLDDHPITVDEKDPTVPEWAKQPTKPSYTASEVGALPDTYTPPNQTAQQVGADPAGTAVSAVSQHNTDETAHNDLRLALQGLSDRINAALDSDDTTLDQMSEVVSYIKSNKSMIDAITTSKVNVSDIVNNLTTNVSNKPLSAAQGVVIKTLIDALRNDKLDAAELTNAVNTALAQAKASGEFDGADGAPGPQGPQGERGPKGEQGIQGPAGPTGPQGPAGNDGYTPVKGVDYFDGAKGDKGDKGDKGEKGADGKSAYQYAQEGGYTGTEAAFAEKLAEEMPDRLPNPNALTFTGAVTGSYDGSAPLSVEIPSGGGGGELTAVLIATIEGDGQSTMIEQSADLSKDGLYAVSVQLDAKLETNNTSNIIWFRVGSSGIYLSSFSFKQDANAANTLDRRAGAMFAIVDRKVYNLGNAGYSFTDMTNTCVSGTTVYANKIMVNSGSNLPIPTGITMKLFAFRYGRNDHV